MESDRCYFCNILIQGGREADVLSGLFPLQRLQRFAKGFRLKTIVKRFAAVLTVLDMQMLGQAHFKFAIEERPDFVRRNMFPVIVESF